METRLEITVRSTEVDYLGHVNNAKYLEYMEWGREDWLKQVGSSFNDLVNRGLGTATVNININYLGECYNGDQLIIKTAPLKTGTSSFVFYQEIFKKVTMEKVADARITIVVFDITTRKSRPIPPYLLELLAPASDQAPDQNPG